MMLAFLVLIRFTFWVGCATTCAARSVVRGATLQLVGIASYSSSLRLAPHPTDRTTQAVQLPNLG